MSEGRFFLDTFFVQKDGFNVPGSVQNPEHLDPVFSLPVVDKVTAEAGYGPLANVLQGRRAIRNWGAPRRGKSSRRAYAFSTASRNRRAAEGLSCPMETK
jgi:hypothetical protein